jgi:hypothetical protein
MSLTWHYGFCTNRRIFWPAEKLLASQLLCTMELGCDNYGTLGADTDRWSMDILGIQKKTHNKLSCFKYTNIRTTEKWKFEKTICRKTYVSQVKFFNFMQFEDPTILRVNNKASGMWRHRHRFGETHCPLHQSRWLSYFEILVPFFQITHYHIPQNRVSVFLLFTHKLDNCSLSLKCVHIYRVMNARPPRLLFILP